MLVVDEIVSNIQIQQHYVRLFSRKVYIPLFQLQDLESSIFAQRQALLAEMDSLKLRGAEVKRQSELDKQMLAVERERLKMKEEQLASREEALKLNNKRMSQK